MNYSNPHNSRNKAMSTPTCKDIEVKDDGNALTVTITLEKLPTYLEISGTLNAETGEFTFDNLFTPKNDEQA